MIFINQDKVNKKAQDKALQEAKTYLDSTDHKMFTDYEPKVDEDLEAIKAKRKEARDFIRDNK